MNIKQKVARYLHKLFPLADPKENSREHIAQTILANLRSAELPDHFRFWERYGFHITPNHFYSPIPDTQLMPEKIWDTPAELVGIDMKPEGQMFFLEEVFPKYSEEFLRFPTSATQDPTEFYLTNTVFDGLDALVLHCMVRHFRPRRVIECGCGFSTLVTVAATRRNGGAKMTCVEPFPPPMLGAVVQRNPGVELVCSKVEDVPLSLFKELGKGDLLFIDTSHVVRTGGDVNYLYLEVIPRLAPGVIIHMHDIFFPWEYPKDWILKELRFWNEQYLLQAFLLFNSQFEVLFANYFMDHFHRDLFRSVFPNAPCAGSSFWMRRN